MATSRVEDQSLNAQGLEVINDNCGSSSGVIEVQLEGIDGTRVGGSLNSNCQRSGLVTSNSNTTFCNSCRDLVDCRSSTGVDDQTSEGSSGKGFEVVRVSSSTLDFECFKAGIVTDSKVVKIVAVLSEIERMSVPTPPLTLARPLYTMAASISSLPEPPVIAVVLAPEVTLIAPELEAVTDVTVVARAVPMS